MLLIRPTLSARAQLHRQGSMFSGRRVQRALRIERWNAG
jgi:hypothetical protein